LSKYKFLEIIKNIEIQISYKISINECSSNFNSALRAKHGAFLNNLGIDTLPFDRDTHPDHLGMTEDKKSEVKLKINRD
jgi:hypothetical protein